VGLLLAVQTILTLLPLQSGNDDSVGLDNESLLNESEGHDPDEEIGFTDGIIDWFFSGFQTITDGLANAMGGLMDLTFGTPIVETDGPFSFGKPESSSIDDIITNELISYGFYRTYEYAWLGDGGPMAILAVVIMVVGISLRGLFDMVNYDGSRKGESNSYIVGFIWIAVWYPLFLGFVNIIHATMATFAAPDGSLAYGMTGAIINTLAMAYVANVAAPSVIAVAMAPWVILGALMFARAILITALAGFGPILIAGKHTNLPVISRVCASILDKSVPIVLLPMPIAPIMFVLGNFIFASPAMGQLQFLVGGVFFFAIGCLLLFATWMTFKIVSPTMASAGGTLTNIGAAVGVIATGGGGSLAYSAMRGGPMAAAARAAGNRWGGNDGSRR